VIFKTRKGGDLIIKKTDYFTRFPHEYIQCDIESKFLINKKFYIVYILIDKYRTQEDYSWITIGKILKFLGYKFTGRKKNLFYETLDCLKFLQDRKMIKILTELNDIDYDTGIEIKIISENFDAVEKFTIIHSAIFNKIMESKTKLNKETLLLVFLYINSYIYIRKKSDNGTEHFNDIENRPEAFFRELRQVSIEINLSPTTLINCIQELIELEILKKHIVGSIKEKDKVPRNVPNIYVLNKHGYQQEIKWAEKKLKEMYKVDKFHKFIHKKTNQTTEEK